MVKTLLQNAAPSAPENGPASSQPDNLPMPKQVSALNTFLLVSYISSQHPGLDISHMIESVQEKGPFVVENLETGKIEPISVHHLSNTDYWFSNRFMIILYEVIQKKIPDPNLGYRIGKTACESQSIFKTAIGIPLLGPYRLLKRISRENQKYNRTKSSRIIRQSKGRVVIRITHKENIIINDFAKQWHAGLFESYALISGATDVRVTARVVEKGPGFYGDTGRATWDFDIRFKDKPFVMRLVDIIISNTPTVKKLIKDANSIQEAHNEQILQRDRIIRKQTEKLKKIQEKVFKAETARIQNRLNSVAEELATTEERERSIIAEDLHDSVSQSLGMGIARLKTLFEQKKDLDSTEVKPIIHALETSLSDIRSLTFRINPPILKHLGLTAALNWLIDDTSSKGSTRIRLSNHLPDNIKIQDTCQTVLYRCLRELIINIQKHSQASKADITLNIMENHITISVEDNGIGFNPEASPATSQGGYGLHSIATRMKYMSGDMEVYSSPGNGTNIILSAPLHPKDRIDNESR